MPVTRSAGQLVHEPEPGGRQGGAGNGSPKQRGKAAADAAADQGRQVAATARRRGQDVAGVATQQAQEVTTTAKEQAAQLTQELSEQGRALYEEARQQVEQQAEDQMQSLAQALHRWGSQTQALADGRPEQAGTVGQYASQWADKLHDVATGIENRGVSGLVEEMQDLARRSPGGFLLGAAVVGFAGGRLVRSASSDNSSSFDDSAQAPPNRRAVAPGRRSPVAGTGRAARRNPPSLGGE